MKMQDVKMKKVIGNVTYLGYVCCFRKFWVLFNSYSRWVKTCWKQHWHR